MDTNFLDYCVKSGVLNQQDCHRVLAGVDDSTSVYEMLVRSNIISQEQLAVVAGEYYQCPVVDLSRISPEPNATSYGTSIDCHRFLFIPFAVDPVAGVLVALVDYSCLNSIKAILKAARVERMKFYIAPYDTMQLMLDNVYGSMNANPGLGSGIRSRRTSSLIQTQGELEHPGPRRVNSSVFTVTPSSDDRRLQAMAFELAGCREENSILRRKVEQLSAAVELESNMIRELGRLLKNSGVLSDQSFDQWLYSQR